MKIIVTGGAGFIGSHLVDAYLDLGHDVVILDDLSTGQRENINPKAKFHQVSILDPGIRDLLVKEAPDAINHHAAHIDVRRSVSEPKFDLEVNVAGILNLMQACAGIPIQKIIFASSGGAIYGEQSTFPATEDHDTNPLSPYGINKLAGEKYLGYFAAAMKAQLVCLRYANIYGPRQNAKGEAGVVSIFIEQLLAHSTPTIHGSGTQTRDYVFVEDVVQANLLALQQNTNGVFNVGTGVETDVNQIYSAISRFMGIASPARHGPAKAGEQMRSSLSAKSLQKTFGYGPFTPLEKGLQKTVDWFKAHSLKH